ncbi:hypothetical protein N7448_003255 [Penicillium atrosanguineum]|uniref:Erythromycin esterase n=1 Tax=Penicillium atrosanguineum TaxID=1132637 RepID=A0A9W9U3L8_9EURO|nr:uncharacterized protein N7443_002227 [Penicillium atrosanguineum]KAJ5139847.1 hypothetical protein N7448_003255 [Penicillium atrosanguineum]KAJ5309766.1 hypothetical protein N7443_002227 [Penicillium atrosanguineum]KAJ5315287.1 hypothetical protein N7476_005594 [Penicillium atrosanguineum]
MAVRRSARLRSVSSQPEPQESSPQPETNSRLPSVAERDETARDVYPTVHTPVTKKTPQKTPITAARMSEARTPTTGSAARPSRSEMHPSKTHQSTTKQADSGLILGFNPIKKDANGNPLGAFDSTPSKSKASPAPSLFGTPGYEFKFGQDSQLSEEAKRLMDSVRGEVTRIKSQMIFDKSKESEEGQKSGQNHGDRKIAMPKGRASRFSDVHMVEFKKMDSIANHPSSFRATPGRFQPVTTGKSLKRTKSKAQLDDRVPPGSSLPGSPSKSSAVSISPAATTKRAKHNSSEDASTSRLEVPSNVSAPKPTGAHSRATMRSSLMTPTRASMARIVSTSIKAPKTTLIPSLARSPSTKAVTSPRTPRTDFNPRIKGNLPSFSNLKSILRRRQPLFSRDPSKIASGTHVAAPDFNPDVLFAKDETTDSAPTPSPKKHVEFTPSVKSPYELVHSPSRSKIPTTPSRSNVSEVVYPTLPTLTPDHNTVSADKSPVPPKSPSIRHVRKSDTDKKGPVYPELPVLANGIAHGIINKKRHRGEVDDESGADSENVPPADAHTGERGTKRFKANPPPTPSPVKNRSIKTPSRSISGRLGTPTSTTASAKQKARGVLSLSRLNMLSKPKSRTGA